MDVTMIQNILRRVILLIRLYLLGVPVCMDLRMRSLGLSPGLGFIHVGHDCSLVYDIADLYKAEIVIPTAFQVAADTPDDLPAVMRRKVRDAMVSNHILERMVHDIRWLFQKEDQEEKEETKKKPLLDNEERL